MKTLILLFDLKPEQKRRAKSAAVKCTNKKTGTKFHKAITYDPPENGYYEDRIRALSRRQIQEQGWDIPDPKCPLSVSIHCCLPHTTEVSKWFKKNPEATVCASVVKPDWDNFGKSHCDALNGIAWVDDSKIFFGRCSKYYHRLHPAGRVKISVDAFDPSEWRKMEGLILDVHIF